MDIFETRTARPMLIENMTEPFDDPNYLYELKLDGERCLAYLDPGTGTDLRNKRNMLMLPKVPELSDIHRSVNKRCILDGELIVAKDGKPDFSEIQRRSLMTNPFRIKLAASQLPASFVAYDVLYYEACEITDAPLTDRKAKLEKVVVESDRLAVSRFIFGQGTALYQHAEKEDLEGVVAKKSDSLYYMGKHTKDWVKFKNLKDDDFVVCGYIEKERGVNSIILGQYADGVLQYKGHVTLGVSTAAMQELRNVEGAPPPFVAIPPNHEAAIWLKPELVCTVKYMMLTSTGSMRQPVFKGLRFDKHPRECIQP